MEICYPKPIAGNLDFRMNLIQQCQHDEALANDVWHSCKRDIIFWIDNFCWTKDPRKEPDIMPWICYDAYQPETILAIKKAIREQHDLLIDKSRDMGVSWMVLYVFQHEWQFEDGADFRVGSRKEEFVDKLGDIDTLFEKVRFNILKQPKFLLPKGFSLDDKKYSSYMKLINPVNGNAIIGESANEDFGSGGRRRALLMDEFSKWENKISKAAWTSTGDVTRCRIPVSCVAGDSIIYTEQGMKRIESVQTDQLGFRNGEKIGLHGRYGLKYTDIYFNSGEQNTLKLQTRGGYKLETSEIHPLLVITDKGRLEWKKASNIDLGDMVAIQYGQNTFNEAVDLINKEFKRGKKKFEKVIIEPHLAYLMGLFLAEGYNHQGHQIIISSGDEEIHTWLNERFDFRRVDEHHSRVSDSNLCDFLEFMGFVRKKSRHKVIPDKILQLDRRNMVAFLQGMFDGDGCCMEKKGKTRNILKITYTSTSSQILDTLQSILLNFGILSTQYWHIARPTKKVKVSSKVGWLELNNACSNIFMKKIGFRLERKNRNVITDTPLKEIIPYVNKRLLDLMKSCGRGVVHKSGSYSTLYNSKRNAMMKVSLVNKLKYLENKVSKDNVDYKELSEIAELNVYWGEVVDIQKGRNLVYDFNIPDGHSFTANGFIGHNTPKGSGNKFAILAKGTKEKIKKISLHWTLHPEKVKGAYRVEKDGSRAEIDLSNPRMAFELWQQYQGELAPEPYVGGVIRSVWYDKECERRSAADVAQELDIDYLSSGYPFFDLRALGRQIPYKYFYRTNPAMPIPLHRYIQGNLVEGDMDKIEFREKPQGWLKIFEMPIKGGQYVLGGDVAEGLAKGDEAFGVVREKFSRDVAATVNGIIDPDTFSLYLQKLGKFYKCIVAPENNNHGYCFDKKTEILTDKGWKYFKDLDRTEMVATLNIETNKIEYQAPSHYTKVYEEFMYKAKRHHTDFCVSKEHSMLTHVRNSNKKELSQLRFKSLESILHTKYDSLILRHCADWGASYQNAMIRIGKNKAFHIDVWLEFLGIFIADGNVRNYVKNGKRQYYFMSIAQSESYPDNIKKIRDILDKMHIHYWEYKQKTIVGGKRYNDVVIFKITNKALWGYLIKNVGVGENKQAPDEIGWLSSKQIKIFLDSFFMGDGFERRGNEKQYHPGLAWKLADQLQEYIMKTGRISKITTDERHSVNYIVHDHKPKNGTNYNCTYLSGDKIQKSPYGDFAYCVTVPNKTVLVRRNGRAVFLGNSVCSDLKQMDCNLYHTTKKNIKTGEVNVVKAGWSTTATTRPMMLDQLAEEIRKQSFEMRDPTLIAQCETFVKNEKTGKPEADGDYLDDGVIATAIGGAVINEKPFKAFKKKRSGGPTAEQKKPKFKFGRAKK